MQHDKIIKDSVSGGWVERMPSGVRPYLRLARYDRPIGFWLLALPGWIGLAFAALNEGFVRTDFKWAFLIGLGAVAMRGAGCTYNDIVDRDLDKQVERTALRPLAAGTISLKSAWGWLGLQCLAGLVVLAFFPRLAQIIAVSSLALVAVYPFMKRITYWPQAWLGLTFNWAVLVAYTAKTGAVNLPLFLLYAGLILWTIGYDTIYACQDVEDDAMIGVKSTARLFGARAKLWTAVMYTTSLFFITASIFKVCGSPYTVLFALPYGAHIMWQILKFDPAKSNLCLNIFKSNRLAALLLILGLSFPNLANLL